MSVEAKSTVINGWTAGRIFREPLLWLGLVLVVLAVLLSLPLSVAIGPMYWDTYLYLDAAQRIAMGQTPNVDFQVPVGPLVYYLFTWGLELFPRAQLLLLAQWCLLAVAAPLMAVVIADTAKRSHGLAFALLIPFLVFALAPVNALTYSSFPSLDGYSIYNRHSVLLLYVLVSGLLFIRDGRKLAWFCALAMLALFLTKITAFLAGGMIGLFALLAGRIALRNVALAALIFVVPLAVSEFAVHFVSSYLSNIAQLVGLNEGSWLSRVLMVISAKLNVLVPVGVMCAMLAWLSLGAEKAVPFFDRSYWWLGVATLAGIAFETQNTGGGQEFIFLWPILLMAWPRLQGYEKRSQAILLVLAAFSVVPTISNVAHRVLRSVAVLPTYQTLDLPLLKNMEQVATRADHMERAARNVSHYIEFSDTYESLARQGQAPSWNYYSELDFQIYFLIDIAAGAQAILDFEAANSVRLNTLMTLEFTNPFPWLLDRDATRHIQIGADPFRTIPPMTPEIKAAIDATDAVIRPKCPVTSGRLAVESIYSEALENRQVVEIHPCWDLLLRPGLLPAP
ncbi:hypothetical protein [Devosia psychrophila]|uniref:4-amino-4-deoxy-L-arabinose transferase n=1 Tax=Devosia psychrophila TaxID=728005 RepID=A0A1I1RV72_9HYPH|nr:hypothetical protein [Devosia psychrophila]SFD38017.1 hypothetical protein SAMN04488059_14813 [Devosia psychrophila]